MADCDIATLPQPLQDAVVHLLEALVQYAGTSGPPAPVPAPEAIVYEAPHKARRRRIVEVLQRHPQGLSPVQVRQLLGLEKPLNSVMKSMYRDGLVGRPVEGLYIAHPHE